MVDLPARSCDGGYVPDIALSVEHASLWRVAHATASGGNSCAECSCGSTRAQHGPTWPHSDAFRRRLPQVHSGYCAGTELEKAVRRSARVDDVVAGLSFAFWHQLFTRRFDQSLWMTGFSRVFPHALPLPSHALRAAAYADLSRLRQLRNRIAHHEPIFHRDIRADLAAATRIIHSRSPSTLDWLLHHEGATSLLATSPLEGKIAPPL